MGWTTESSNFSLPTSRLIQKIRRFYGKNSKKKSVSSSKEMDSKYLDKQVFATIDKQNCIVATIRLINRLADDWYCQFISWIYQLRGYIVISDRHFIFEAAIRYYSKNDKQRFTIRLHKWLLENIYVKPDLVILLDAPPDVLYKRKKEATLEILKIRRNALFNHGRTMPDLVLVDSSQPLEVVYKTVSDKILKFLNIKNSGLSPN